MIDLLLELMIMANPQNIDFIYKIIIPITIIFIGLVGTIIGYILGIHKERSNIKWKERREAIKKLYSYLQRFCTDLQLGNIPNEELGNLTKEIFYNEISLLPKNIDNKIFELSYYMQNFLLDPKGQTEEKKLYLIEKLGILSMELKKKLT